MESSRTLHITTNTGRRRVDGSCPSAGSGPRHPTRACPRGQGARSVCIASPEHWQPCLLSQTRRQSASQRPSTRVANRATSTWYGDRTGWEQPREQTGTRGAKSKHRRSGTGRPRSDPGVTLATSWRSNPHMRLTSSAAAGRPQRARHAADGGSPQRCSAAPAPNSRPPPPQPGRGCQGLEACSCRTAPPP